MSWVQSVIFPLGTELRVREGNRVWDKLKWIEGTIKLD